MTETNDRGRELSAETVTPASRHPFDQTGPAPSKILVIDDEVEVRKVLVESLCREGYDVWEADDGAAALEHLERQPFELVLTDIVMPQMDGLTLVRTAIQRGYAASFIVMTAHNSVEAAVEAMKSGAADYLPKPFPLDLLQLVVARTLHAQRLAARAKQVDLYEKLAQTDGLTELHNYRFFQQRLSIELNRAQRFNRPLSLIMLDLDDFKAFNDVYGHQSGDQALRKLAWLLQRSSRSYDLVARYGGDEFVIILPETGKKIAAEVAERIRGAVEKAAIEGEEPALDGHFTASLGLASFPEDATDQGDLIRKADLALYQAKTCGRNRVSCYDAALACTEKAGAGPLQMSQHPSARQGMTAAEPRLPQVP
jgi:diguanylate cyclase (GGDEF)-like protein